MTADNVELSAVIIAHPTPALQNEQLYAMLVVRIGVLEASMFARLGERLAAWRIRHVARTAFQDQVGFAAHGEPIDAGLSVQERAAVAHRIDAWLRDQVAHTATPYGVSHCCVLVRLVDERVRRTVAWTYRSAAFERVAVAEALTQVSEHIQTLPLGDYPMANRIEAHLISLGAVVQHADVARRVSAEK
jgi:hypothetical protein